MYTPLLIRCRTFLAACTGRCVCMLLMFRQRSGYLPLHASSYVCACGLQTFLSPLQPNSSHTRVLCCNACCHVFVASGQSQVAPRLAALALVCI